MGGRGVGRGARRWERRGKAGDMGTGWGRRDKAAEMGAERGAPGGHRGQSGGTGMLWLCPLLTPPSRCPTAELIQTEIHHVRTLKIMGSVFRRAMLEELQLDPGTVQKIFPCVDELSQIHERFLAQLLERRRDSLAQDSNKNFVINRLGDILVGQVG